MDYHLSYKINDSLKTFDVSSASFKRGEKTVTFDSNLFSDPEFLKNGYILRQFPSKWKNSIERSIQAVVSAKMQAAGVIFDNKLRTFSLDRYHDYVNEEQHQRVVDSFRGGFFGTGGIDLSELGIDYKQLNSFINKTIKSNKPLSCKIKKFGLTFGKFWIRIVRPNSNDNNPPHKDSHLKRLRKNVNIYLPLAGSNKHSSLPLIPGSHLENESEYISSSSPCFINEKKNTVPCIVHRNKGLNMICPNPKPNQIMIFTPHLIHGGGINSNKDITRVSLEMRFFANE
jgi:hypothetical protein